MSEDLSKLREELNFYKRKCEEIENVFKSSNKHVPEAGNAKPASSNISESSETFPLSSPEKSKYDDDHPLAKLRKLRHSKENRQMTNNPLWNTARKAVSTKIKGVKRRELPGWECHNCSGYYAAASLHEDTKNLVSRHRCSHERPKTPPGFFSLDLEEQCKTSRK